MIVKSLRTPNELWTCKNNRRDKLVFTVSFVFILRSDFLLSASPYDKDKFTFLLNSNQLSSINGLLIIEQLVYTPETLTRRKPF